MVFMVSLTPKRLLDGALWLLMLFVYGGCLFFCPEDSELPMSEMDPANTKLRSDTQTLTGSACADLSAEPAKQTVA